MERTRPALTPEERRLCERMINKVEALDATSGDPEVIAQIQAAKFLVMNMESLVTMRMAWAALLGDEPEGALH